MHSLPSIAAITVTRRHFMHSDLLFLDKIPYTAGLVDRAAYDISARFAEINTGYIVVVSNQIDLFEIVHHWLDRSFPFAKDRISSCKFVYIKHGDAPIVC